MEDRMIEIHDVVKQFGEQIVLNHVSLDIYKGRIYGLIGRNGSGKTVLFKSICGFLPLDSGYIKVQNSQIGKDIDIPQNIGIIIEHPGFLANYSAFKNLKFLSMLKKEITDEQIRDSLRLVGLDPNSKKWVSKYSMGMRQRLGIAQAIMENPPILILDEPFNGLDKDGVEEMRKLLLQLKEKGKTILLASHSSEDISILCDEVYEMDKGTCTRKDNT